MTGHPLADRIVGVDVGGNKTHLAALDTSGVRRDVIEPSSRWRNGHLFSEPGNLPRLAGWLSSVTALDPATRIVIGLRDCDTDADLDRARRAVRDALGLPVRIENDADLLAPASGDGPAIAMIVGTGSIISARTAAGQRVTADGYGWLVDGMFGIGLARGLDGDDDGGRRV